MNQATIINILTQYDELFEQYNIAVNLIRSLLMMIIEHILRPLCNAVEDVYIKSYQLLDFTEYGPVVDLINEFKIFIYVALIVSFMAIGYLYIFDHNNRPPWIKNAFIGVICVLTLPTIFSKLNDFTQLSSRIIMDWGNESTSTVADTIILDNSYDLKYMVSNQFYNQSNPRRNAIGNVKAININEVVTSDDVTGSAAKSILKNEVTYDITGVARLKEIKKDGLFIVSDPPYYYRWHIDFLPMMIQLIGVIFAYLVLTWKVVQLLWELIVDRLLIVIFSGDLTGNQRLKKMINFFVNAYIVLILINVFIKFYQLFFNYITAKNWGSLTKALITLFISFCVAHGPNLVQQILGIDAGISNGFGTLYAATTVARSAVHLAKKGADTMVGAAGAAAGASSEIINHGRGPRADEGRSTMMNDLHNNRHSAISNNTSSSKKESSNIDNGYNSTNTSNTGFDIHGGENSGYTDENQMFNADMRQTDDSYEDNNDFTNHSEKSLRDSSERIPDSSRSDLNKNEPKSHTVGTDNASHVDQNDNKEHLIRSNKSNLKDPLGKTSDSSRSDLNKNEPKSHTVGTDNASHADQNDNKEHLIRSNESNLKDLSGRTSDSSHSDFNRNEPKDHMSGTSDNVKKPKDNKDDFMKVNSKQNTSNNNEKTENNAYSKQKQEDTPLKRKPIRNMQDLTNERKEIIKEHRDGITRAELTRNSTIRSLKKGYQNGKTSVKLAKHGIDLVHANKKNKKD